MEAAAEDIYQKGVSDVKKMLDERIGDLNVEMDLLFDKYKRG